MKNYQPITPPTELAQDDVTPETIVAALEGVISDVNEFLSEFCQRVDQDFASRKSATISEAELRKRLEEFTAEKNHWEANRERDEQRINQKFEQLTEAWLRLEEEQRSFLRTKNGSATSAPQRTADSRPDNLAAQAADESDSISSEMGDSLRHDTAEPRNSTERESSMIEQRVPVHSSASLSKPRESAIRQFQRLKKEIESSRSNSGLH